LFAVQQVFRIERKASASLSAEMGMMRSLSPMLPATKRGFGQWCAISAGRSFASNCERLGLAVLLVLAGQFFLVRQALAAGLDHVSAVGAAKLPLAESDRIYLANIE